MLNVRIQTTLHRFDWWIINFESPDIQLLATNWLEMKWKQKIPSTFLNTQSNSLILQIEHNVCFIWPHGKKKWLLLLLHTSQIESALRRQRQQHSFNTFWWSIWHKCCEWDVIPKAPSIYSIVCTRLKATKFLRAKMCGRFMRNIFS